MGIYWDAGFQWSLIVPPTDLGEYQESSKRPRAKCPGMHCPPSQRCIPQHKICDGVVDCLGAEDELNCQPKSKASEGNQTSRKCQKGRKKVSGPSSPTSPPDAPSSSTNHSVTLSESEDSLHGSRANVFEEVIDDARDIINNISSALNLRLPNATNIISTNNISTQNQTRSTNRPSSVIVQNNTSVPEVTLVLVKNGSLLQNNLTSSLASGAVVTTLTTLSDIQGDMTSSEELLLVTTATTPKTSVFSSTVGELGSTRPFTETKQDSLTTSFVSAALLTSSTTEEHFNITEPLVGRPDTLETEAMMSTTQNILVKPQNVSTLVNESNKTINNQTDVHNKVLPAIDSFIALVSNTTVTSSLATETTVTTVTPSLATETTVTTVTPSLATEETGTTLLAIETTVTTVTPSLATEETGTTVTPSLATEETGTTLLATETTVTTVTPSLATEAIVTTLLATEIPIMILTTTSTTDKTPPVSNINEVTEFVLTSVSGIRQSTGTTSVDDLEQTTKTSDIITLRVLHNLTTGSTSQKLSPSLSSAGPEAWSVVTANENNVILETTEETEVSAPNNGSEVGTSVVAMTLPLPATRAPTQVSPGAAREVYSCTRIHQNIPADRRCDRTLDCEDGSDEVNCTCREYLLYSHPHILCDGNIDCADRTDELDCSELIHESSYTVQLYCSRAMSSVTVLFHGNV
uniref:Uncharacterized protein n=1 Tax=Timema monikensis TaxID=170555 RepID=A0A7R9EKU2_9NEOP|nr:unnamed protein product [Timema monikensis]